jgi:hypothetical protein
MAYVWQPRVGEVQQEHHRVGNEGFVRNAYLDGSHGPWACHPLDDAMLFYPEWIARLRDLAPERGWEDQGLSPYHGRNTRMLRHEAEGSSVSYFARVDVDSGYLLLLSQTLKSGPQVVRTDIHEFREFGVQNSGMGRPPGMRCP